MKTKFIKTFSLLMICLSLALLLGTAVYQQNSKEAISNPTNYCKVTPYQDPPWG